MPISNPSDASPLIAIHKADRDAHHLGEIELTVPHFQSVTVTGDFQLQKENLNDNNTATDARANGINQYVEVKFYLPVLIKQYRHFGEVAMNGTGRWKIQYFDGEWHDWETGMLIRTTADWSAWIEPAAGVKLCSRVRLVCTAVDTAVPQSRIMELEIKY